MGNTEGGLVIGEGLALDSASSLFFGDHLSFSASPTTEISRYTHVKLGLYHRSNPG